MNAPLSYFNRKSGKGILSRLHEAGLAPSECTGFTIEMPIDGLLQIVYTCHVSAKTLDIIGKDFVAAGVWADEQARAKPCE